jgi:GntR family transcriptional regulator / MocR family aminotransferase
MDVLFSVDPAAPGPLHRRLYDSVRTAILTGRLRSGDRLPATRALATQLSLSRATVSAAYDQLRAEGYLRGHHGSGTYVAPDLPEETLQSGMLPEAPRAERHVPLSAWGKRIAADEYGALLRSTNDGDLPFDFRPHRVAAERFPWDDWSGAVHRALARSPDRFLAYPPSAGYPPLLDAVAAHVARYRAVSCEPDQVVMVSGTQQGLNLLATLVLDRGDRVAVEDPGYPAARLALEAHGLCIEHVPIDRDGMRVDVLAEHTPQRLVHVTPSHQHPTGATMSLSRRLALLDLAERTGCIIFEDDYDSEFRYEGRPIESLQGLDRSGLVVYAGTFSKSILPGLRMGYLVLPRPLVTPFVTAKSLWDSGTPMLEQAALAEFLHSGDFERHIRRMRRLYQNRRDALLGVLAIFGERVQVGEHQGGLNLLLTVRAPISDIELAARAAVRGIALRPASPYYLHPPEYPTFLLGFGGVREEQIVEGMVRLRAILDELPGSQ